MTAPVPSTSATSPGDASQPLLAELRALRNQVQSQHGLIAALTGQLGMPARTANEWIRTLTESLPTHPRRAAVEPTRLAGGIDVERPLTRPIPAEAAWWPVPSGALAPLRPSPGWALYGQQGSVKAVGFSVVGLSGQATRDAVDFVARAQRNQRNFVPVFLTDLTDLRVFSDQGFVAEYIPASAAGSSPARRRFLDARKDLIQRKWNLASIFDMTRTTRPNLDEATLAVADRSAPEMAAAGADDAGPEVEAIPPHSPSGAS